MAIFYYFMHVMQFFFKEKGKGESAFYAKHMSDNDI